MTKDEELDQHYAHARVLSALADPTRLEILTILLRNQGTINVMELVEEIGRLEQPTVSHHLRILLDSGIVYNRKKGLYSFYRVNGRQLRHIADLLEQFIAAIRPAVREEVAV